MSGVHALDKERIWPTVDYRPHRVQRRIHRSKARHRVVVGGRRGGKSQVPGHELTVEALLTYTQKTQLLREGRRREFWIVGPEYTDSEKEFRVVYNDLARLEAPFDHPGTYNNPHDGDMVISLWAGRFIVHAKSAKYPGTLVGEGLSGVVLAEAAKLKPVVWHKYIRPTLADFRGWSIFDTTPEGKNWLYELWQRGQDPEDEDWESWRMPAWMNPYVYPMGATPTGIAMLREALSDPEQRLTRGIIEASGVDPEIIDMMRDMTEERFNQEIGAEFTDFVGRVFKGFDEETHVTDLQYDPKLPLYFAVDYGFTNPFVVLLIQIDVWDNVYVIGEYRRTRMDITDIARELQTWRGGLAKKALTFYPDPESPGDTAILAKELRVPAAGNTGGELKWRLDQIRQLLKLYPEHAPWEQRRPRILFDRSCEGIIKEMQDYRYPDTKVEQKGEAPENPLKKDDHGPEALGRFTRGHYGGPAEDKGGRARQSTAKVAA